MKKCMLLALLMVINMVGMASSPKIESEKIFEDLDLYDSSLSITIIERKDQTIRSVTFKNKPDLLKKIQKALTSDKDKAYSKSLVTDNGELSESVVILNEDEEIKIGLTTSKSKEVYFFMKIRPKNNSSNSSNRRTTKSQRAIKTKKSERTKKSTKNRLTEDLNDFERFNDFSDLNNFAEMPSETKDKLFIKER